MGQAEASSLSGVLKLVLNCKVSEFGTLVRVIFGLAVEVDAAVYVWFSSSGSGCSFENVSRFVSSPPSLLQLKGKQHQIQNVFFCMRETSWRDSNIYISLVKKCWVSGLCCLSKSVTSFAGFQEARQQSHSPLAKHLTDSSQRSLFASPHRNLSETCLLWVKNQVALY